MKMTVPRMAPRNPLVRPSRFRLAGAHGPSGGAQRQRNERELRRELQRLHDKRKFPTRRWLNSTRKPGRQKTRYTSTACWWAIQAVSSAFETAAGAKRGRSSGGPICRYAETSIGTSTAK